MAVKPFLHVGVYPEDCTFYVAYPGRDMSHSDLFANVPVNTERLNRRLSPREKRGWVAIHNSKHWILADALVQRNVVNENAISFRVEALIFETQCERIAIGIDPRMKREDIDGATIIKKNADGTKWLFSHSPIEDHHDRMLLAETAMATLFDELTYSRLSRVLTLIIQDKPKNQQLGEAAVMEHIRNFKHDCMRMARWHEGELTIGDHIKDPEEHYIYNMLQKAFATAEKKWKVEKSAEFNQINDHLAPIKKRLASRHSFKYRWEKPTVFPDAQQQSESTEE